MKAADIIKKKDSSKDKPVAKPKASALLDWIGNRRTIVKKPSEEETKQDEA